MLPDELEKRLDGIEDASKKGYPVRNLYKIACEPGLWLQAYVNIRANAGALTQGVSTDTIDGFSIERAEKLAKTLQRRSSIITNGIRIVRWVIARHGNICGSGLVMG